MHNVMLLIIYQFAHVQLDLKEIHSQIVVLPISFQNQREMFAHHHHVDQIVNVVMLANMLFAHVCLDLLVHRHNVDQNVLFQANVLQHKHVLIKSVLIHALEFVE